MTTLPASPDAVKAPHPKRDAETLTPIAAIRAKCLHCCCGSVKAVKFCTVPCDLWPFRFGKRPATILKGPLARFLDPAAMPDAQTPLEDCR